MWDKLKNEIKNFCINFSQEKWRHFSREKIVTTNRLSFLKRQLASGNPAVKSEILNLEFSLKKLFERQLEGSKIRSRAQWLEDGEIPSKFFLRLDNERHTKSFVSSVYNSASVEVSTLPEIMEAHTKFYTDLFSHENIDLQAQHELFSHVTSRLSEAETAFCEGPLTLAEVSEALRRSNRNKSPGADGLTVEFYAQFWEMLGSLLVNVFNQGLAPGELPNSMKASVTCLIHKKDDKRSLKSWRPISLLNYILQNLFESRVYSSGRVDRIYGRS